MATQMSSPTCSGAVEAMARYGLPADDLPAFGQARVDDRLVTFHDMRDARRQPSLADEGFGLFPHSTAVRDFEDGEVIADVYLDEVRDLVREAVGTDQVYMQQNWVLRAETRENGAALLKGGRQAMTMKTGGFVHLDYDDAAAEMWARFTLEKHGVADRPEGRLLVITAWRALSPGPQDKPLALIDRRTVSPGQYIPEAIQTPIMEWRGSQIAYDPAHRFCWWSDMHRDELILFLQHEGGYGPGSGAPHTAFDHPGCIGRVAPRHSLEVRAYAFVPN